MLRLALLFLACLLGAAAWAADDLAAIPPLKARVTDLTGTLSAGQSAQLERDLAAFEQQRGSQIAVLMVPTTAPEPIEMYSIRVAEAWQIGRRRHDDGVLIVVAKDDRRLRIDVGYGLEGAIPDAIAKRVVAEVITPRFRQGDFFGGLRAGVAQIQSLIEGEQLPPPEQWRSGERQSGGGFIEMLVIGIISAVILGGILNAIFGRLLGSGITGGVVGTLGWLLTGSLLVAVVGAVAVFLFALIFGGRGAGVRHGGWGGGGGIGSAGGWGGGTWGGGSGGGSWGGGGGGFGGGGASGNW